MFAVAELTPDEAVFDMEQADYGFYLSRDLASGESHLLFANAATASGNVLYWRYDGHYGLITPEWPHGLFLQA